MKNFHDWKNKDVVKLLDTIDLINSHNIEGDIVECGVWKGGNLICAQKYLNYLKVEKSNWIIIRSKA